VAVVPLVLAAGAHFAIWALPMGATAALLLLLDGVRRRPWAQRAAALEASAVVAVGTLAAYATAVGSPPPLNVPTALAFLLLLGTPVVAWAARTAGGEPAAASKGVIARLAALRWDRALVFGVVILAVTLGKSAWAFPAAVPYAWLAASYSALPLFGLCLLCLPGGRLGQLGTAVALTALLVAVVWDFASTEVVLALAEPLTWEDLLVRFEDPASLRILAEGLRSWAALLLTLGVFGGFAALSRLVRRLPSAASAWTLACMVALVIGAGRLLIQGQAVIEPRLAERYLTAASAPWSPLHARPAYESHLDLEAARAVRRSVEAPIWEEGPSSLLAPLAGRYAGRSVVLVVLESHRASDIEGLGEGALNHRPSSPRLYALARDGLLFTNYFQASRPTHSALWELVTGLPYLGGPLKPVYSGPEAARLGRMPDFAALGYQCDWICPHSIHFDNWDGLMQEAGARFWINPPEVEGLERTYWSAWGLPDADLMEVARRRFETVTSSGRLLFLGVLTVSNHMPYSFPDEIDGMALTHDLHGGMRYADHAVGGLIDALRRLPEPRRPIVFVTADTTDAHDLREAEPMGITNLEGLRIPGLLLLPDRALAGRRFEGLFGHGDLLDLLHLLVAPENDSPRFVRRHRAVVSSTGKLLTSRTYYDVQGQRFFEIVGRWHLRPVEDPPDRERLLAAQAFYERVRAALWSEGDPQAEPPAAP
jgi:hypothetical protein